MNSLWLFLTMLAILLTHINADPECIFGFYTLHCQNATNAYYDTFIDSGFDHETRVIKCQNCNLESIEEYMFNKNPKWTFNIQDIEIINNAASLTLIDTPFRGLLLLEWLKLYNSRISSINSNTFEGIPNLKYLYLQNNNLTQLPNRVFGELTQIIKINLNNNQIRTIKEDAFHGLFTLRELLLANNQIKELDSGYFNYLRALKVLVLAENPFEKLNLGLLIETMAEIKFLNVEEIPCVALADMLLESIEKNFEIRRYVSSCDYTKRSRCLFVTVVRQFDKKSVIISSNLNLARAEITAEEIGFIPCKRNYNK